jgi:hypothetical protein
MKTKAVNYSNYLIAYMDILGFKQKVEKAKQNTKIICQIYNVLRKANIRATKWNLQQSRQTVKSGRISKMFSDTILLTDSTVNSNTLLDLLQHVAISQYSILMDKFFLRGAIISGDHFQKGNVMFGPTYLKAYEIETQVASWPRIVLDDNLLKILTAQQKQIAFWALLERDYDGIIYVDYIKAICTLMIGQKASVNGAKLFKQLNRVYIVHKNIVIDAIKSNTVRSNTHILVKYYALAKYHNMALNRFCTHYLSGSQYTSQRKIVKKNRIKLATVFPTLYP